MSPTRPLVAVVGGGITGLAAAHRLATAPNAPRVVLLERGPHVGGRITTAPFAGREIDLGPEALLTRPATAIDLCEELGIGDALCAPATLPSLVWARGRLRPLPAGLLAGLPAGAGELLRSRVLSPAGVLRAGVDLVLPQRGPDGDETIGALVRRRLGDEVLEHLIDPLLGGIHAGSCDTLSVRALAPHLAAASRHRGGLVRGLRAGVPAPPDTPPPGSPPAAPRPMMMALDGGIARLADALLAASPNLEVRRGTAVERIEKGPEGARVIHLTGGERLTCDGVLLAAPAAVLADLLIHLSRPAAAELAHIRTTSVAVVALALPPEAHDALPAASGFLVPPAAGTAIAAATFSTRKWPHLQRDGAPAIVRCSVRQEFLDRDDDELAALAAGDLARMTHATIAVMDKRVVRHRGAFPQYEVDHLERVARVEEAIARVPGVEVAGASLRGAGLAACIAQGHAAAERLLDAVRRGAGEGSAHALLEAADPTPPRPAKLHL